MCAKDERICSQFEYPVNVNIYSRFLVLLSIVAEYASIEVHRVRVRGVFASSVLFYSDYADSVDFGYDV